MQERDRLLRLREHMALSQRELAAEFQVSHGAIAQWENGEREIPGPVLRLLAIYEDDLGLTQMESLPPTSYWQRTGQYSRLAGGVGVDLLKHVLTRAVVSDRQASLLRQKTGTQIAVKIAKELASMKGLGTKAFQMLNNFAFLFPDEVQAALSKVTGELTPMPQKKVAEVFNAELGAPPRQLFSSWSTTPLATASVGQVHVAKLKTGEPVAVKVQYPQIAEAIRADLKNFRALDKFSSFLLKSQEPGVIMREFATRFEDECDYRKEAVYQEQFRELFHGKNDVVIPKVHREFSTTRILTTDYVAAQSFNEFCATASQVERDRAALAIWRMTFEGILRHGIYHADPHPGNFLFADRKVIVIDFGCVTQFDPKFVRLWHGFLRAIAGNDFAAFQQVVVDFGIVRDSRFDFEYQWRVSRRAYRAWADDKPFMFTHEEVRQTYIDYFIRSPNRSFFHHSKEWVFLLRLAWCMPFLLASLRARVNWKRHGLALLRSEPPSQPPPAHPVSRKSERAVFT